MSGRVQMIQENVESIQRYTILDSRTTASEKFVGKTNNNKKAHSHRNFEGAIYLFFIFPHVQMKRRGSETHLHAQVHPLFPR